MSTAVQSCNPQHSTSTCAVHFCQATAVHWQAAMHTQGMSPGTLTAHRLGICSSAWPHQLLTLGKGGATALQTQKAQ